jgi:hypothetical protein
VWVDERAPRERFRRALRVSGPGIEGVFSSVSIAADGRVCLAWDRVVGTAKSFDADIVRTEVSWAAPGHAFSAPEWQTAGYPTQLTRLSCWPDRPDVSNQAIAVDAHGHGIAVWDAAIRHKNRPVARSFTLPQSAAASAFVG